MCPSVIRCNPKVSVAVFDAGHVHLYPRNEDGTVAYGEDLEWPAEWPKVVDRKFCEDRGIKVVQA